MLKYGEAFLRSSNFCFCCSDNFSDALSNVYLLPFKLPNSLELDLTLRVSAVFFGQSSPDSTPFACFLTDRINEETLEVKQRSKLFGSLKGNKYTLLKIESKLSSKQKEKLKVVKKASPLLRIMYSLKEKFKQIFESNKDLGSGTLALLDWVKKAEPYFKNSVSTIKLGWEKYSDILNTELQTV
ncbi:MAG TPA: transposase [Candidatus Obscuribacterales bacterium]